MMLNLNIVDRRDAEGKALVCCTHGELCEVGKKGQRRQRAGAEIEPGESQSHVYENAMPAKKLPSQELLDSTATRDEDESEGGVYEKIKNGDEVYANLRTDSECYLSTVTDDWLAEGIAEEQNVPPTATENVQRLKSTSSQTIYENVSGDEGGVIADADEGKKDSADVDGSPKPQKKDEDDYAKIPLVGEASSKSKVEVVLPEEGKKARGATEEESDYESFRNLGIQRERRPVPRINSATTLLSGESNPAADKINPKEQHIEFYIGVCSAHIAEVKCQQRGIFRLYHRVAEPANDNEDQLHALLPLYIAYRTFTGNCRHIRILRTGGQLRTDADESSSSIRGSYPKYLHALRSGPQWRVDIDGEPTFSSLGQLVTFYDIYASFANNFEPFPSQSRAKLAERVARN